MRPICNSLRHSPPLNVQPAPGVVADRAECAFATEIGAQVPAEAKVIRAPRFSLHIHQQHVAVTLGHQPVVEPLEIAPPLQPGKVLLNLARLNGAPGLDRDSCARMTSAVIVLSAFMRTSSMRDTAMNHAVTAAAPHSQSAPTRSSDNNGSTARRPRRRGDGIAPEL